MSQCCNENRLSKRRMLQQEGEKPEEGVMLQQTLNAVKYCTMNIHTHRDPIPYLHSSLSL